MADEQKPKTVGEFLRYDFTETEIREKSKDLALAVQTKTQAQEEKKAADGQFKERIDGSDAQIGRLSREINMGWEMRTIDCRVDFHTPSQAFKRITRLDTGEVVREVPMLASELQANLFVDPDVPADASESNITSFFANETGEVTA